MTYRFATEEEIEKAIRGLDIPEKDRLLRKVFAERDAWRELAHQYAGDGSFLDAEAARIMEGK